MATRDLTPQDEGNKAFVPDEDGAGVRGQTGDDQLDAHTESNDTVVPDDGVHPTQVPGNDVPEDEAAETDSTKGDDSNDDSQE